MSLGCSTGWRRRAVAAMGVVLPALALVLATSQAGQAATIGAGWHDFSPSLGTSSLEAMYAPTAGDAWAVGQTSSQQSLYLHFDGSSWSSVNGPDINTLYAVDGTSSSDLWVLGATSSAHYDGSAWTTYPLDLPAGTEGVGILYTSGINQVFDAGPNNAYARVLAVNPDGSLDQMLEHFDGSAWSFVTDAPNISTTGSVVELTGSGPDDVYAYALYDNNSQEELVHYDGTSWSVVSLPGSPVAVRVYDTGGQALALGDIVGGGYYAAALSGGTWSETDLPGGYEPLDSAAGAGTVWTVMLDGSGNEHLWRWSGGQWTEVQPDNADGLIAGTTDGQAMWSFTEGGSLGGGIPAKVELYVK